MSELFNGINWFGGFSRIKKLLKDSENKTYENFIESYNREIGKWILEDYMGKKFSITIRQESISLSLLEVCQISDQIELILNTGNNGLRYKLESLLGAESMMTEKYYELQRKERQVDDMIFELSKQMDA